MSSAGGRRLDYLQCLVQKQRRRKPRQWPPRKPSVWHTAAQLAFLTHIPLKRWLCDSHVLASAAIGPISQTNQLIKQNIIKVRIPTQKLQEY